MIWYVIELYLLDYKLSADEKLLTSGDSWRDTYNLKLIKNCNQRMNLYSLVQTHF